MLLGGWETERKAAARARAGVPSAEAEANPPLITQVGNNLPSGLQVIRERVNGFREERGQTYCESRKNCLIVKVVQG